MSSKLVIVESPAKAKTIGKYLGRGYAVKASMGHVRDLPKSTLGIDVEADSTTGQYNKAVIRNAAKGDVHVVNIDPKFSRHFYTNYFWRTM